MGTNGPSGDLNRDILLDPQIISRRPIFAASHTNLFSAYVDNNNVLLTCSKDMGGGWTNPVQVMQLEGPLHSLRISSRDNVVVVVALQETNSGLKLQGVTGTFSFPDLNHRACPVNQLDPKITSNDILDVAIRINDDFTSDDFIIYDTKAGASASVTGHHPRAPQ